MADEADLEKSSTSSTEMTGYDEASGMGKPVHMPLNVAAHIFSYLSRDDIENCKLVCSAWMTVIRIYNRELPKRKVDCLWLSTCYEFGATVRYKNVVRQLTLKKYFRARDQRNVLMVTKHRVALPHLPTSRFPCKRPTLGPDSILELQPFLQYGSTHNLTCKQRQRPRVYNLTNSHRYEMKLFTPPYAYYEELKRLLIDCDVRSLVFCKFTFTNLFVEKFVEFFASDGPFCVEDVNLHSCNLHYVNSSDFQELFGRHIRAERYFMEYLRFCLPNYINVDFIRQPNIKAAAIFFIGQCFARDGHSEMRFALTDEQFRQYIEMLIAEERDAKRKTDRQFFGIRQTQASDIAVNRYRKTFELANEETRKLLYKQVMFGQARFAHQLPIEDMNEMVIELHEYESDND